MEVDISLIRHDDPSPEKEYDGKRMIVALTDLPLTMVHVEKAIQRADSQRQQEVTIEISDHPFPVPTEQIESVLQSRDFNFLIHSKRNPSGLLSTSWRHHSWNPFSYLFCRGW